LAWCNIIILVLHVIYIGSLFLKYLMSEDGALREEVLDKDEFRHLWGLEHGTDRDVEKRLDMVREVMARERLSEIRDAMERNDVNYLLLRLRECLEQGNDTTLELLSVINHIAAGQLLYPVESTYPIKHAVALLGKEEQEKLLDIMTGSASRSKGYRYQMVVSDLILMLDESRKLAEWVKVYAPHLEGRSLWQISPEIWHEAGGLARVMQYHGAGMKELIGQANVRFRHIEPHYRNRVDAAGIARPLDYTNRDQITHPVQGDLEEIARFTVTVGGREVKTIASRGVNDLGIEVYLIGDEEGFYTHSLYNYRNPWEKKHDLPTWEEFSVFYSKASLELVKIVEEGEKEAMEKLHKEWKAPLLHLNDSQTALVAAYRKIFHNSDPVIGEAVVAFTTHTYGNRKEYPIAEGYGDNVLDFMEIPSDYREMFKHCQRAGDVYDMASGGLRTADWQGAVARAHRDDVFIYDDWANYPEDPALDSYYRDMGVEYDLVAVSNGDHRSNTMKYFTENLIKLYGEDVDVEHPSADQVREAKKLAKLDLRVSDGKNYYSTHTNEAWEKAMLSPDQMVISYSGRLVPEKAGRTRAFTDANIEQMLKGGIQLVIYGNVQSNNSVSYKLRDDLIALIERMKGKNYPGRLIFVPRFSLDDQRALLAATDVQVQDSHPSTEAAGFTEADVSACGGIEVGTPRSDNEAGEGLFQAQGVPMDLKVPGQGNVLTPERLDEAAYLDAILMLHDKYIKDELKHYQATSVRLSRILEARLTSAAYLREFSKAIEYKEYKKNRDIAMKNDQKDLNVTEGDMPEVGSFLDDLYRSDPERYRVYSIARSVCTGDVSGAVNAFFTNGVFQGREKDLASAADIFNSVIEEVKNDIRTRSDAREFFIKVKEGALEFSSDKGVSGDLQLMAGQALTIISWIDRDVEGATGISLTADATKMARAGDAERGKSFILLSETSGPRMSDKEGAKGFYWRGIETLASKLKGNTPEELIYDRPYFEGSKDKLVMYLMDHGFMPPGMGLEKPTWRGEISTIHETRFLNDMVPGSYQTTSTGVGHFQGSKLDLKHITEGRGIQFNVKYDASGKITGVIAQKIEAGDWCVALPGHVDYMVNLGGLSFNDLSFNMDPKDTALLMEDMDISGEDLSKISLAFKNARDVPYLAVRDERGVFLARNSSSGEVPDIRWLAPLRGIKGKNDLIDLYSSLTWQGIPSLFQELSAGLRAASNKDAPAVEVLEAGRQTLMRPSDDAAVTDAKTMIDHIDSFSDAVLRLISEESASNRLFRVPVEVIDAIGIDNIRELLTALQATEHCFLELYSTERPEGARDTYGLATKALPADLTTDKRTRANTITIFPVFKGESLSPSKNKRWNNVDFENSIIMPVGYNYDRAGIARSVIFGLMLSEIASDDTLTKDSSFVADFHSGYVRLCLSQGAETREFDLTAEDIVSIARGDTLSMVEALNKLIRLLPIKPLNIQELKAVYDRMIEVLIRA
jgi:glycogen synthase